MLSPWIGIPILIGLAGCFVAEIRVLLQLRKDEAMYRRWREGPPK